MRKIAPYYQQLLKKAREQIKSGFPVSFIGMFDGGVDYLFGLMRLVKLAPADTVIIPVDLTETRGDLRKTLKALQLGFSLVGESLDNFNNLEDVWSALLRITKTKKVVFIFYFGYKEKICLPFFNEFLRWRFLLGLKLNWIVCATYGVLNQKEGETSVLEKIIKSNIVPVVPHSQKSAKVVLNNFIEKYGKIKKEKGEEIIKLSGGNPGIMKGLFLLVDENLTTRLKRILGELSNQELSLLLKFKNGRAKITDQNILKNLRVFGYIKENDIFSPIVKKYLPIYYDESGTNLSSSQNKVFKLLKEESPEVVSRDRLAQAVWGGRWREKYSDWAIDQTIYSLRLKLKKLQSTWELKTKRNGGYYLIKK